MKASPKNANLPGASHRHSVSGKRVERRISRLITACLRCRLKKIKCDRQIPSCSNCLKSGVECVFRDPESGNAVSRASVYNWQKKLEEANLQLEALRKERDEWKWLHEKQQIQHEYLVNGSHHPQHRGSHHNARSRSEGTNSPTTAYFPDIKVVNAINVSHKLIPPEEADVYPKFSPLSSVKLPERSAAEKCIVKFLAISNVLIPIMHREHYLCVYFQPLYGAPTQQFLSLIYGQPVDFDYKRNGNYPTDDVQHRHKCLFFLYIIMATLTAQSPQDYPEGESKYYYSLAINHMDILWSGQEEVKELSYERLEILQAYLLISQFAMLRCTTQGAWYYIGTCIRLCQDMGIQNDTCQLPLDTQFMIDTKRRLFWSCLTLDRQISIFHDRPFGIDIRRIDCQFPSAKDDSVIPFNGFSRLQTKPLIRKSQKNVTLYYLNFRIILTEIYDYIFNVANKLVPSDQTQIQEIKMWKHSVHERLTRWLHQSQNFSSPFLELAKLHYYQLVIQIYCVSPITERINDLVEYRLIYDSSKEIIEIFNEIASTKTILFSWIALNFLSFAASVYIRLILTCEVLKAELNLADFQQTCNKMDFIFSGFASILGDTATLAIKRFDQQRTQVLALFESESSKLS